MRAPALAQGCSIFVLQHEGRDLGYAGRGADDWQAR